MKKIYAFRGVNVENKLSGLKNEIKGSKSVWSCDFFFFEKGRCIFGLDPVINGSKETRRHFTRCANPCLLSIQK
jgi:hypothetical protein